MSGGFSVRPCRNVLVRLALRKDSSGVCKRDSGFMVSFRFEEECEGFVVFGMK